MGRKAKAAITVLSSLIVYVSINSLARALDPAAFIWCQEDKDDASFVASSPSWLDRKACRWLSICGAAHFHPVSGRFGHRGTAEGDDDDPSLWRSSWSSGQNSSHHWNSTERARREIPDYVFDYAPLVHLFSGEQFWPTDMAEHLYHMSPLLNYTPIESQSIHPNLTNLGGLNKWDDGWYVFLTSDDNVESRPPWLEGKKNVPTSPPKEVEEPPADWDDNDEDDTAEVPANWHGAGQQPLGSQSNGNTWDDTREDLKPEDLLDDHTLTELRKRYGGHEIRAQKTGGRSDAPAVLLTIDKGNGILDAFWFYFYSFNLGNSVLNVRFGNHVGDWEHCLVRFTNGTPEALFFSAHTAGEAYAYEAVEKNGKRPVIYSAVGTHAMYGTPGLHPYILPWGLLHDETDRGPLWDPLQNMHTYTYDFSNDILRASTTTPSAPTDWFYFNGHWGDKFYRLDDDRQYRFAGQYHYVNGPIGPRFKHLGRGKVCQGPDADPCVIKSYVGESKRAKRWTTSGTGEEHP